MNTLIAEIKTRLIERETKRIMDFQAGIYELEEGEILEQWNPIELHDIAVRIASSLYYEQYTDSDSE